MKSRKYISILLIMLLSFGMLLSGCGLSDSIGNLSDGITELFSGGAGRNDSSDNDDDDDDDDDDDGKVPGNSGGSNSYSAGHAGDGSLEDQYQMLVELRNCWHLGARVGSGYTATYGVSDLDENGRIEVVQRVESADGHDGSVVLLEVNENYDGIDEVQVVFNGHSYPDVSDIYGSYSTKDGMYYTTCSYAYNQEFYYIDYYVFNLENGVINAQLMKYAQVDMQTYEYEYYDASGNEMDSNKFYDYDMQEVLGEYSYLSKYYTLQEDSQIGYPDNEVSDTDLYYFIEHSYSIFMDRMLTYGQHNGKLTVYTDPTDPEYQALQDVVVLNEGAKGVPVRFKCDKDAEFGLVNGYWSDTLECFLTEETGVELYFNRAYELILDIPEDGEITQAVVYGEAIMAVTEENFGTYRGCYVMSVGNCCPYMKEKDRYVQALGIVAYEVFMAGSEEDYRENEEFFFKTISEIATYVFDIDEELVIPEVYYQRLLDAFFDWDWEVYYLEEVSSEYIQYHEEDGCTVYSDPYTSALPPQPHYVIRETDYSEALAAIKYIEVDYYAGATSSINYIFEDENGKTIEVDVVIEGTREAAFTASADFMYFYD